MSEALPMGYTVRAPALEDAPALVTMMNRYASIYYSREVFTGQHLLQQWKEPGFDITTDAWVVSAPDGQLVGYGYIWRWQQAKEELRIGGQSYIHPEYEGRGIGTALLQRLETRGQQLIPEAAPDARVYMMQVIGSKNAAARQLLAQQGYAETRHDWVMEITFSETPPAPAWPDGISIRTFVPGQDKRLMYETLEEAFQDHRGHRSGTFERWEQQKLQRENVDPTLWFLAMDGAEVAGACLCYTEPDGGLVDELGVRRPWRQRGLGMALLRQAFGTFYRRGILRVELGVDAESLTGATRLYERAGMHITDRLDRFEKDL
jgi:mycothiol synthase